MQVDPIEARNFAYLNWSNSEMLPPMPTEAIMMGDFNSLPESKEYKQIVGDIDPCYRRVGHLDGYVDTWTSADDRSDERITWLPDPPDRVPGHGLTLDYCFVSPKLGRKVKRAWVYSSVEGSDHRPYWVELEC